MEYLNVGKRYVKKGSEAKGQSPVKHKQAQMCFSFERDCDCDIVALLSRFPLL